jgi:hypothetical protein
MAGLLMPGSKTLDEIRSLSSSHCTESGWIVISVLSKEAASLSVQYLLLIGLLVVTRPE